MKKSSIMIGFVMLLYFSGINIHYACAIEPDEVMVLANRNAAESVGLAMFYMKTRKIPKENLLLIWMTDRETCSRMSYETKALTPVKRFLKTSPAGKRIRCIVTMYGVPLRIASPGLTMKEKEHLANLKNKEMVLKEKIEKKTVDPALKKKLKKSLSRTESEITNFKRELDRTASFDSELALAPAAHYSLKMWIPNPFFIGFQKKKLSVTKNDVLMTCRLDGPSPKIVKRIILDSIAAEKKGLKGRACFDARWKDPGNKKLSGYAFYDQSIHRAADIVKRTTAMNVLIDDKPSLFKKGECPDTALYCGWYSLAHYVNAFTWTPGSVGYHIASSECTTLKQTNSQVWCKRMLEKGISATIGPVGEPYVQAFPVPEIFFSFLIKGYLTLAESYMVSLPYISWKMVLVGDPLYRVKIAHE